MVAKKSKRRVTKKAEPEPVKPDHAASSIESNVLPEWDVAGLFSDEETRKILDDPSWEKLRKEMDEKTDQLLAQLRDESWLKDFSLVDENTPLAPPPKVGDEGERKGTPQDVARWMSDEIAKQGRLYQNFAAQHIINEFGGGFLYPNKRGNLGIDLEVLREFWRLTATTVGWVKPKRYWRLRRPADPPGREVGE